jgi:rhomboid protease GluP
MIGNKQPITTTLVGMNVAVFAAMALTGVSPVEPAQVQLLKWGANWGPLSLGAEPWRMLASNYIHIGIVHILLNMWCLWNLGFLAERVFDPWTYVLIYTVCGLAGSEGSLWWHPLAIGAGASGAIFGLAGALIAALYLGHLPISKQAIQGTLRSLLTFAGYNLFFGAVARGIDNSAHIGGLVAGLALGAMLAKHLMQPPEIRDGWRRGVFIAAAVVLFLTFMLVKHLSGNLATRQGVAVWRPPTCNDRKTQVQPSKSRPASAGWNQLSGVEKAMADKSSGGASSMSHGIKSVPS